MAGPGGPSCGSPGTGAPPLLGHVLRNSPWYAVTGKGIGQAGIWVKADVAAWQPQTYAQTWGSWSRVCKGQ